MLPNALSSYANAAAPRLSEITILSRAATLRLLLPPVLSGSWWIELFRRSLLQTERQAHCPDRQTLLQGQ